MKAVDFVNCGPPEVLTLIGLEKPRLKHYEVLIKVVATAVSNFDICRRMYIKIWPGINPLLGMECSGEIVDVGTSVISHQIGDKVCALLGGGGYAEYVAVRSCLVLPIPKGIRVDHAATLPYTASVVWNSFFKLGKLIENSTILIYNGAGEFGPLAIQLAKSQHCVVLATGTSEREMQYCKDLGADFCIKYDQDFIYQVLKKTKGRGVDFIFDPFGFNVHDNLVVLSRGGTLVIAGPNNIKKVAMDFELVERKQIKLIGHFFVLLPIEKKQQILKEIVEKVWPMFDSGKLVPRVYDRRYHFHEAAAAHLAIEKNENLGDKILLVPTIMPQPISRWKNMKTRWKNMKTWR